MGGGRKCDPEDCGGSCSFLPGVQITQAGRPAGGRGGLLGVEMGAGFLFLKPNDPLAGMQRREEKHIRPSYKTLCPLALTPRPTASIDGREGLPPGVSGPTTARQRWDGGSGFPVSRNENTQDQRLATADETTPAGGIASPLHPLVLKGMP